MRFLGKQIESIGEKNLGTRFHSREMIIEELKENQLFFSLKDSILIAPNPGIPVEKKILDSLLGSRGKIP